MPINIDAYYLPGDTWKRRNGYYVPYRKSGHPLGDYLRIFRRGKSWTFSWHALLESEEMKLQCVKNGKRPKLQDVIDEVTG